jgi:hypothetical protein
MTLLVRNRDQLLSASYYIGWAALLAAFVAIGGRELWIGSHGKLIAPGPFASTDSYLEALLEVPNASETCLKAMSKLAGPRAIVYFCPRRDPKGDFVFGTLAYLSSPQQIEKVEIDHAELEQKIGSVDRASTSAFIFFGMQAPSGLSRGWRIGPNLLVVPLETR